MDPRGFRSTKRGEVRKATAGYWAFVPASLPRSVKYSDRTALLLDEATGALYRLGGVGRLIPNPTLIIGPHVRLEAVLSSKIEGTKSEVADLLKYQAGEDDRTLEGDVREVSNYVRALDHGIRRLRDDFPMSLRLVRELHEVLMRGVRGEHATPGEFRRSPNWIGGTSPSNAVFVPPPVDEMKDLMDDWESFMYVRSLPLLIQLAMVHYQFEVIHPFLDGNGRVGRILLPMLLIERGALPQPLLYLSVFFERYRDTYYDLLLATSQRGEWDPWFQFFLTGVAQQARDAEERTIRLVELQQQVRGELLDGRRSPTVLRLAELLFDQPYVSAKSVQRDLGVTNPTAQAAIEALVELSILREITGRQRNRYYFAGGIYKAVYADVAGTETDLDIDIGELSE